MPLLQKNTLPTNKKLLIFSIFIIALILFSPILLPFIGLGLFAAFTLLSSVIPNPVDCSITKNNIVVSSNIEDWSTGNHAMVYVDYGDEKINLWQNSIFYPEYKPQECNQFLDKLLRDSYIDEKFIVLNEDDSRFNILFGKRNSSKIDFVKGYVFFENMKVTGYGVKDSESSEVVSFEEFMRKKVTGYTQINDFNFTDFKQNQNGKLTMVAEGTLSRSEAEDAKFNFEATFDEDLKILTIDSLTFTD